MRRPMTRPLSAVAAVLSLLAGLLLAGVAGGAAPAGAAPGYPVDVCPTLAVSTTVPQPGERIIVSGVDFEAGSQVRLVLKPVRDTDSDRQYDLGTVRANSQGSFRTGIVMPADAIGVYDVVAVTGVPGEVTCPADPSQRLNIGVGSGNGGGPVTDGNNPNGGAAPNGGPGGTAFTGFNMLLLLLIAAALIALGVYVTRKNRTRTAVRA